MRTRFVQNELGLSIEISDELLEKIETHVDMYFPNESGGVFIGQYSDDRSTAIINDILVPEVTQSTPVSFRRIVKEINNELKRIYKESGGRTIYLGEWHSHPLGPKSYSDIDYRAISRIASDSNIKIDIPVLCIISGRSSDHESRFFIFHNNNLYSLIKEKP